MAVAMLWVFHMRSLAAVILTPERIATALRQHALENSRWKAENIEVRVLSYRPVSLESNSTTLRVLRPTHGISAGLQSFLIAVESGGREQARVWVKAEVRVFEKVVVSSEPLGYNQIVRDQDVRIERRDVSGLNARTFYRVDDVVGQQVTRAISLNEPLTDRNVDHPNLVRRGAALILLYETGAFRIETPGTAEENGRAGDLIQVKNPSSGKLLRGVVIDGRRVMVHR